MTAQALLFELHQQGVKLRLTDGRLDIVAPTGSLSPELRERLRAQRDDIVALLSRAQGADDATPVMPRPDERYEPFPLTDIQHAYWFGRNASVELGGYSTHYYFELDSDGELDVARLNRALNAVIARHDMLRAVVQPDGLQRVLAEVPEYQIPVKDLRDLSAYEQEAELSRLREQLSRKARPAETWPLFDIRASLFGSGKLRLHFSFNLLIVDYYSLLLLFADWRRFYLDPHSRPAALTVSFRDYVVAAENERGGERYRAAEEYWRSRLADLPSAPDLPLAASPAQVAETEFVRRQARIGSDHWEALKLSARRRGLTPSTVLMSAYADVLRAWSGRQPAFTLNLTIFDRPAAYPALGEVIGDFTSLVMLAVDTAGTATFTERAQRLTTQLMRDLEHIDYSGVQVLRDRARVTASGLGAAMPVVFTSAIGASSLGAADERSFFGEEVYGISQTPQVWLDHQVMQEQGELVLIWDAVDALFPAGLLDDMFGAYLSQLERLCLSDAEWDATGRLFALPSWQSDERDAANDTTRSFPDRTLCELVDQQAERQPDAIAIITAERRLTYAQVTVCGRQLARELQRAGVRRGELVAVVLDKGWEQVAAVYGIVRSSAAYLPIDPQWPEARRRELLDAGRVRMVVTTEAQAEQLAFPDSVRVLIVSDKAEDDDLDVSEDEEAQHGPAPDDLAYVIFTSGSTGRPKGVMIDHRGAANTIQDINLRFGIGAGDRVLALSALTFDLSVYDVFGTLAAGATIVMPSPSGKHDPGEWTELMRRHGVTVWNSVPALAQAWVDSRAADVDASDVPAPRLMLLSGDWIPVTLPDAVRALCPGIEVISLGGATEASIWSVHYPIGMVPASWTRIPYGKPLANQTLHVYDDRLEPCPAWAIGEIYIGGLGLAMGYWADPEQTRQRFVVHPVSGERLYRTGDLGRYLPGGDIEFLGREDFQVKLNGYRIELEEVAAAIRRLPGVGEAVARVAQNPATGRRQLIGYAVPAVTSDASDNPLDPRSLREALEELLPGYLVPHQLIPVHRLPLNANGKVDPTLLPVPWEEAAERQSVAPRDTAEQRMLDIWQEVLGRDDFGVDDDFFDLGADSLHAVQVIARLRTELGLVIDNEDGLQLLFENPTVAQLAVAASGPVAPLDGTGR